MTARVADLVESDLSKVVVLDRKSEEVAVSASLILVVCLQLH